MRERRPAEMASVSTAAGARTPSAYRLLDRLWAQPGWLLALGVYALTRVIDAVIIVSAARGQVPNMWTSAHPGYFDLAVQWDGSWYREIALHGYPSVLPHDANGALQQNAWGFSPAYPYLVRAVMGVTGLSFPVAGALTSLVVGAGAIVVVYQLFARYVDKRAAVAGIVLLATLPCAPVLQICYTESLALLVLASALLLLVQRRYALAVPVVILLSLTRPVELPFAAVVLVHLVVRWRRRSVDPFPGYEAVSVIGLGLVAFVSAWLWPAIAWHVTGVRSAYTDTMGTWRTSGHVEYFRAWWFIATYLEHDRLKAAAGLVLIALVLLAAALGPWARPLGPELRAWCVAYPAYLAAVLEPWTSVFRYVLLLFPLGMIGLGGARPRDARAAPLRVAVLAVVVAVFLVGQVIWVYCLLKFVPPTDYPP
jgi:hypothetical protein